MRKGWEISEMVNVCDLITCGVAARPIYVDVGIPFLSAKNVKNGKIVLNGYNCVSKETHQELTKNNKPLVGDILYTRVGSFGEAAVIENDIVFSIFVSLTLIKVKKSILSPFFLKYYLNSDAIKKLAKKSVSSSGVGNLNVGTVRKFPIPIPPLPEQQQIVAILNKAFAAIDQAKANVERNLENAKELFQSRLEEAFIVKRKGWTEKRLREVAIEFGRGKSKHRPRNDKILYSGKYPFIQTGDVRNAIKFITKYSQTYNEVGLDQSKLWPKGTVCITIAANIAETAILNFDGCFPDSIIGITVDPKKTTSDFVYYALQFLKTKLKSLGYGSAQDNINLATFENQYFPFPDLNTQNEIVDTLDKLLKLSFSLQKKYILKIEEYNHLKKAILQKAFDGELTHTTKEVLYE